MRIAKMKTKEVGKRHKNKRSYMNLLDLVNHVKKLLLVIFSFSFSSVTKQKYTIYRKALLSCLTIPPKRKKKNSYMINHSHF